MWCGCHERWVEPVGRAPLDRRQALKMLLLSHIVLQTNMARSISVEHARLVAGTGGVVGIFPVNTGGYHGSPATSSRSSG